MKAIIREKYGSPSVISLIEVPKPSVKAGEVLVKIHAASINNADVYILQGKPFPLRFSMGLFKPKLKGLGSDISGIIEEVGEGVKEFSVGEEVFGQLAMNQDGGYAEYATMKPVQLTKKPSNVSHSQAASSPMASLTAIQGLKLANVQKGTELLIYGASGGVGTFLIQIAKSLGAKVTAICSTRNIEVAKKSGADKIIDYKKEKWDKDNVQYDVIIAANGHNKIKRYRDALKPNGKYVISGGSLKQIAALLKVPFMFKKQGKTFKNFVAKISKNDLEQIASLLASEQLRPHIDKEFTLEQTKDALEHFMQGKTIGKTIIKVI